MTYSARVLADSLSPDGFRITSFELVMPRIVLAEWNTHRNQSRVSASSRAIPVEKQIKRVLEEPFVPHYWGKNQKGMQADEELTEEQQVWARDRWLIARDSAVDQTRELLEIGVHKQLTNRLIEPFMWHTVIDTATEFSNLFHLRNNPHASPEIQGTVRLMQEAYERSVPAQLQYGQWHLPLIQPEPEECVDYLNGSCGCDGALDDGCWRCTPERHQIPKHILSPADAVKLSCARCARVSYLTHDGKRDPEQDLGLYGRLITAGHMSPFENAARPMTTDELEMFRMKEWQWNEDGRCWDWTGRYTHFLGNVQGWVQQRKLIPGERDILGYRKTA